MLFRDVAAKVANRPGGYTRILKMGNRLGDNASMALIELVDYNEVYTSGDGAVEKKTTRRRGSKAKKTADTDAPAAAAKAAPKAEVEEVKAIEEEAVVEAPVAEAAPEETQAEETPAAEAQVSPAEETQSPDADTEVKKGE